MKVLIIPAWYTDTKDVASFIIDQIQVVIKKGVEVVLIVVVKTKKQFLADVFKRPVNIIIENNITYLQLNYYSLFPFHFFKLFFLAKFAKRLSDQIFKCNFFVLRKNIINNF